MKSATFTLLLLFACSWSVFGQKKEGITYLNMGLGYGANYGVIGTKTVVGPNNSGLMLGLGTTTEGLLGFQLGAQISSGPFFLNVGYGVLGTHYVNELYTFQKKKENYHGVSFMLGIMTKLDKAKRLFFELGIGHSFAAEASHDYDVTYSNNKLKGTVGIGYRFLSR
jgi:hypothetical protein